MNYVKKSVSLRGDMVSICNITVSYVHSHDCSSTCIQRSRNVTRICTLKIVFGKYFDSARVLLNIGHHFTFQMSILWNLFEFFSFGMQRAA